MKYFLLITILFFYSNGFTQTCPVNIDFEQGSFSKWESFAGKTYTNNNENVIELDTSLPIFNRHQIISADSNGVIPLDEYGKFPKLCPYGGKYSVKLGNDNVDGEAEGLKYTFTVPATEDTFSFTYFYAVVFEDPQHAPEEQPRFFVTAYETASGNLINCASYNYISTGGLPGFKKTKISDNILYKEWSPVSIQFVGLANKQVTLEFKTADCTLGGHFGYAYLDIGSGCSNILATAPYCIETNSLLLNAPYGFQYYTWYNETFTKVVGREQNLVLSPPPLTTGKFWVDLEPYPGYGCRDTVYALVTPLPVPDTPKVKPDYVFCQNITASALEASPSINSDLLWYADTTKPGSNDPLIPSTSEAGISYYYVSQKVLFGCESFKRKLTVKVDPVPFTSFKIDRLRACQQGNAFTGVSTSTNLKNPVYQWSFGDGNIVNGTDSVSHSYSNYGSFPITLKITNGSVCYNDATTTVTVVPKPVADFTYPPVICQNETQVAFKDQSSVPQQLSSIIKWQWVVKGNVASTQDPPSFIAAEGGEELPVSLTVATDEGCISDTLRRILKVHFQPHALFTFDEPLCNNKFIHFSDRSFLPAEAAGENINTWQWQMDNVALSTQNPVHNYTAGYHQAMLTVKTNFGCSSLSTDTIIKVNPKPDIAVNINDSCVYRKIIYRAEDLSNSVSNWYWNLGSGLHEGNPVITKYFYKEGDNSFTLMAKTDAGCMDTIHRPFRIYINKAFAGSDTLAAFDQPVQLNANGGTNNHYTWSPSTGLNDAHIENPVAVYDKEQLYTLDAITNEGCDAHSNIFIRRFKGPEIYIPTAFTPNNDRLNDILRAMPVGMKKLGYFAVYNRYGQQVFYTTDFKKGWDGYIKNTPAQSAVYVALAQAIDYTGKAFLKKVSVALLR